MLGKKVKSGQNQQSIFPSHQGPALDKSDLAGTLHVIQSSLKFQWDHLTWHEWWCVDIAWDLPWFSFMVDLHLWFDLIWFDLSKTSAYKKKVKKLWSAWYLCSKSKQHVQSNQTDCALLILKNKTWLLLKAFINLSNQSPPQENLPFAHLKWSSSCCRICAKSILHLLKAQHNLVKLTWTSVSNEHLNNKDLTYLSLFVMLA